MYRWTLEHTFIWNSYDLPLRLFGYYSSCGWRRCPVWIEDSRLARLHVTFNGTRPCLRFKATSTIPAPKLRKKMLCFAPQFLANIAARVRVRSSSRRRQQPTKYFGTHTSHTTIFRNTPLSYFSHHLPITKTSLSFQEAKTDSVNMNAFADTLFAPSSLEDKQPLLLSPTFAICRALDVRRVHSCNRELRLSMDVPGATRENLVVKLQRRGFKGSKPEASCNGSKPEASSVNVQGTLNGERFSKTVELPSTTLDLSQVRAKLADGILEIIVPKAKQVVFAGSCNKIIPVM